MLTVNAGLQEISMNKRKYTKLIKIPTTSLLFKSFSMCNQVTNENTDNSAT